MMELTVVLLAALAGSVGVVGVSLSRHRYLHAAGAVAVAVIAGWGLSVLAPWLTTALVAGLAAVGALRWSRSSTTVNRWASRSRRKSGMASATDIARVGSAGAMRRKTRVVRPSYARQVGRLRRSVARTVQVAVPLARAGVLRVWASIEDVILVFGAPRSGKSVWLIGRIIDAPGAVLVTSTRLDLYQATRGLRARKRGPVWVFNAAGTAGIESSVRFDPLTGCTDPVTAAQRAADLVAGGASGTSDAGGDAARWRESAEGVLSMLLHAAALGGLSMRTVADWAAQADPGAYREVTSLLRRSGEPGYLAAAEQFFGTNDRTRTSITHSMQPALRWLLSPAAVAATETGAPLDVEQLLRDRGTVYLLGATEAHTAPLITALTGHIAREARRLAALAPEGRLDPPLTLALDEAWLTCPAPLHEWTSDMGGRGVTIIGGFQSRAQLIDQWGPTGAAVILNNAGAVMLFGGGTDLDDHEHWSKLTGDRDEPILTRDGHGRIAASTVRRVPVIAPSQLRNLPAWRVVILRRGLPPVIGRVRRTWRRFDIRTQHLIEWRQNRADQAAPAGRPTPGDGHRAGDPAPAAAAESGERRMLRVESTRADRP